MGVNVQATDVRVAVVGAGSMAREHVRAFKRLPGVTVIGIHSRTAGRAEALAAEFEIARVYDSIAQLYESTRAQLVVIAVPELSTRSVTESCFEFPWSVLVEKPAGYDLADATHILESASRARRDVYVALNRRFLASTRTVLADLTDRSGPRFIRVVDQQDQGAALAAGQPPSVVENWMYANSIHVIDYLRVFGRGTITGIERPVPWNPGNPGIVIGLVRFSSGDLGIYEGIWNGPGPWSVEVFTPERRWELRPLETAVYQQRNERVLHSVDPDPRDQACKPGFHSQAEAVVAAVRGEPSDAVTLNDAFESMRLVAGLFDRSPY